MTSSEVRADSDPEEIAADRGKRVQELRSAPRAFLQELQRNPIDGSER